MSPRIWGWYRRWGDGVKGEALFFLPNDLLARSVLQREPHVLIDYRRFAVGVCARPEGRAKREGKERQADSKRN
jgi:hypothetical protein